jgi:hypothetical protein
MKWWRFWPFAWIGPLVILVYEFPAAPPEGDFYGIVAQVIPVLIVAIALDGRGRERWESTSREYRWQITSALLAAEVAALLVIAGTVHSGNLSAALCTVGLVAGFLAVALTVLIDHRAPSGA